MDIAQLEYSLAIVEYKKFFLAAEHLFMSQSSLSKQIRSLEQELGVKLFDRGRGGVDLTPAGRTFLPFAREVRERHRQVLHDLARFSSRARHLVRLGTLPVLGTYGLSNSLADFNSAHPDIQVDILEREQANLLHRLELDQVDFAILRGDFLPRGRYRSLPLVRDEVVVVAPTDHPLAGRTSVDLAELDGQLTVLLDRQSAFSRLVDERTKAAGFHLSPVLEHSRHEPLLSAVGQGIGVSLLPYRLARDSHRGDLAVVPLREPFTTVVSLVVRDGRLSSPWALKLWDYFEEKFPRPLVFSPH